MLRARRKSNGETVLAYSESKKNGPFACEICNEEVILKSGGKKINHFAHVNPFACEYSIAESDEHLRCKLEIYEALLRERGVQSVCMERPLGTVRPDVSAYINGVPVAIEIQISALSQETIRQRTIEYFRKGIAVLWLLPWREELNNPRYFPESWEKWIHACYFGRVYYWLRNLEIVSYRFEPCLKNTSPKAWYGKNGEKVSSRGFTRRLKQSRTPVRERKLHLVRDFAPKHRYWWEGNGIVVPDAKLFMERFAP